MDLNEKQITLGKGGLGIGGYSDITISDEFMSHGMADLKQKLSKEIVKSLIMQAILLLGSPKIFGNIFQIYNALLNALIILFYTFVSMYHVTM